jgi:hypothetical protein
MKVCSCGSGLERIERKDARGIFLTFSCNACWPVKSQKFRPEVLTDPEYDHDEPIED